ncbi:hypothetical protein [Hymenobacter terrenus]|uniref:hypothetical protein n=1 Tax=Hymenobacter terrenus TaxID=1629124 RepID=UPI000619C546|nr:hypothetical protein [Hymenobacter terrenus]
MKTLAIQSFYTLLSVLSLALGLGGCGSKNEEQPLIPYAPVNLSINITNQEYAKLRNLNGAVTIPVKGPAGDGGVRGVIVVQQSAGVYLAFERNCPYRPLDACALVSLDRSGLFMRDSCCNSQFDLKGQITGGPTPRPLKQYSTSLQGSLLNITN